MKNEKYEGRWLGIQVMSVPDLEFKGPIILPERCIRYLEKVTEIERKYSDEVYNNLMSKLEERNKK